MSAETPPKKKARYEVEQDAQQKDDLSFPGMGEGPMEWRKSLQDDGFCVLTVNIANKSASHIAHELPVRLFGASHVQAVAQPAEVSERVLATRGIVREETFNAHTDGHAYGDLYPDYFLLVCERQSSDGGENFLVDGEAVLTDLAAHPETAWVVQALQSTCIDQTSKQHCVSPAVQKTSHGRRMFKARLPGPPTMFQAQRVAANSSNPSRDKEMIDSYHAAIQRRVDTGKRWKLQPGEALLVDNYRMFHGRESYADPDRLLWRIWFWTDQCKGVPEGELFSTPGNFNGSSIGPDKA
eukprot:gnl/MRDRNA2_/MRDRNA2_21732_c0_seq2.p1 gnl/MRDRNA2_/MRDRNA2_21732_c0~~gnl/MRDRNA2_/MRDRNA2_21732_c0_seq2.p1  ORF type:complete len:296 (-),score=60.93 gnl/MRDRNA2_/MRDRNA2_21732_c0_seq2:48-935(-)